MTCWMVAFWTAACRNVSLVLSSAFTASAHSVDRNLTDIGARLLRRWCGAHTRASPGLSIGGGSAPLGEVALMLARLEPPGVGQMRGVGEEPREPFRAADDDRVQARVLGQEEHVLVLDPEDVAEVGVDD